MDHRFRAFTFVDHIHAVQPGVGIQGRYAIPSGIATFSPALVAEAVGQLAAWSVMAAVDFQFRPVAGLAASIELLAPVCPGDVLELAADLETLDHQCASYSGFARRANTPLLRLDHAVGPMLPADQFDDPAALRQHFARLRSERVPSGAFAGLAEASVELLGGEPGQSLRASLQVPKSAPFFSDHFPRRPVFPGSLLIQSNLDLALRLAGELPVPPKESTVPVDTLGDQEPVEDELRARAGARGWGPGREEREWTVRRVTDVKFRAFTPPGEVLEIEACLERLTADGALLNVQTRAGKRTVGSARVHLTPETAP